ncbi:hypothetical protein J6590_024304 [Homalodisca vitripennis]|nr:hypothetical protein J6590_024304 [Homalodisca vitripennis]
MSLKRALYFCTEITCLQQESVLGLIDIHRQLERLSLCPPSCHLARRLEMFYDAYCDTRCPNIYLDVCCDIRYVYA